MPQTIYPYDKKRTLRFDQSIQPAYAAIIEMPLLKAKRNRPLQMTFEDELKSLVFFHLEEHTSAQHLLQVLEEDDFSRDNIATKEDIKKSSFKEAINTEVLSSSPM
ncbi:MAG: hypothetical protein SWO11_10865 [Thermodesulfobacteriota bacterium]|nr:hypothetical protein [Thermodesulfobacteriota bacterium]